MNIQQKSQNGNDTKQPLLTRALLGKASTIFLATQWLAKIMHSAIVSWTSRCCTEQSTNDLVHHNKVAREIDWRRDKTDRERDTHSHTQTHTQKPWVSERENKRQRKRQVAETARQAEKYRDWERDRDSKDVGGRETNPVIYINTEWHLDTNLYTNKMEKTLNLFDLNQDFI